MAGRVTGTVSHKVVGSKMELQLRRFRLRIQLQEAARLTDVGGEKPHAFSKQFRLLGRFRANQGHRLGALIGNRNHGVILQVLAHPRQVFHHRDAQGFQVVAGTDTGQHQNLR